MMNERTMKMTTTNSEPRFTLEQVLQATREVVEEKGDGYIYSDEHADCKYAVDGMPACIVGHVVNRLDPAQFEFLAAKEEESHSSEIVCLLESRGWLDQNFWSSDAERAMGFAQAKQDVGETWSTALAAAENLGADAE
jgi:hypothetical protein